MDAITLSAVVGEDRRLVIDLPPDTPTGPIEVTIRSAPRPAKSLTREEARGRLLAAGALRTDLGLSEPIEHVSDEEIKQLGKLPPGARSSEEIIAEGRGHE